MFERQIQHVGLLLLLSAALTVACRLSPETLSGSWAGLTTLEWLVLAVAVPIIHQFYVMLIWRAELHHGFISKWLGRETGFFLYAAGFGFLFVGRAITLIALAISNYGTWSISPVLAYGLAAILVVPWIYTMYSVIRYFGIRRAFGADHFDPAYQELPFVKEGVFRFTSNAMYGPGFLLVWLPALLGFSQAALLVAAFNHVYIWVHYYTTELPDIRRIYGSR